MQEWGVQEAPGMRNEPGHQERDGGEGNARMGQAGGTGYEERASTSGRTEKEMREWGGQEAPGMRNEPGHQEQRAGEELRSLSGNPEPPSI
jgi:hypothetical protein